MIRSARLLIVVALCIALVSSLGMSATAAPMSGDAPVATVAKKKKKKRCRKGYVLKRVTVKSGKRKGKRAYRCVKWKRNKNAPRLSPAG